VALPSYVYISLTSAKPERNGSVADNSRKWAISGVSCHVIRYFQNYDFPYIPDMLDCLISGITCCSNHVGPEMRPQQPVVPEMRHVTNHVIPKLHDRLPCNSGII
jgi:hypothetical protein